MDKPRHFSMIREFHLADFLTLGNAACGVAAVFLAMLYMDSKWPMHFFLAAALAPCAFAFDVFDGKVARSRNQHSELGRELDSLADVISFGVAPAALGFAAGLRGGWDAAILVYFVCCGVSRLARFNVTAEKLSEGGEKEQCGWLKDKCGVTWQIVPNVLGQMLQDKDAKKSERVMEELLQMKKIDIQGLSKAYAG